MNIGMMISSQAPQAGGGFTFEDDILQAFFRRQAESPHTYFLVGYAPTRPAGLDATGLPWLSLHRSRELRRSQKHARWMRAVRRKLRMKTGPAPLDFELYPDLMGQPLDLICYLTPLTRPVADIPYITNVWDIEHRAQPFFPEISLRGEWESREKRCREIFSRAAYVLTPNARGKEELVASYGLAPERVRTLAHPTPGFALREMERPPGTFSLGHLGITGDYLFYPAQFWAHKNHVCLLLALKEMKVRSGYRPQLVFCGSDKGNREYVEQFARTHGVDDQVVFTGFVSREDLVSLYRHALALVYPSFGGPENLPPLEAFALGCPVIASDIPGTRAQLADAAILVDPTQPGLWAETVLRFRKEPELRDDYIARGRQRAVRYTGDHFARDLLAIFDEFAAYRRTWR
jgi:glycosyltransferase involved in cell wall biosynthesis